MAAWTADVGATWSGEWLEWPRFNQFWSQVVRWTLAPPEQGDLRVLLRREGRQVLVRAEALRDDGTFLDRAPTEARIRPPSTATSGGGARLPLCHHRQPATTHKTWPCDPSRSTPSSWDSGSPTGSDGRLRTTGDRSPSPRPPGWC